MLRQTSSGSVTIISLDRDELWGRLRAIARRIQRDHSNVLDVRLFGSIARGDYVGTSDVDILVVLTDAPDRDEPSARIERSRLFFPYFDLPIGVDLLVYTEAEIERGTPFLSQIYAESVSLLKDRRPPTEERGAQVASCKGQGAGGSD